MCVQCELSFERVVSRECGLGITSQPRIWTILYGFPIFFELCFSEAFFDYLKGGYS